MPVPNGAGTEAEGDTTGAANNVSRASSHTEPTFTYPAWQMQC